MEMNSLCRFFLLLCLAAPVQAQEVKDDFSSLNPDHWTVTLPGPGAGVQVLQNELALSNRGYVFLKGKPWTTYTLQWQWNAYEGQDPVAYGDHFLILVRSTGKVNPKRAYEPMDGLVVRINAGYGKIAIEQATDGKLETLVEKDLVLAEKKENGKPAIPPDVWYKLRVEDKDNKISVFVGDAKAPAIESKYDPKKFSGSLFGLANREHVAGPKRSRVKEFEAK